jgi:hypothetical protein
VSRARATFLALWTLAVAATVSAFVLHLALRGRMVELGYELGRARQEQSRLREVKRVLELQVASYETPERVEIVARTLLGMEPPPPERIVALPAFLPGADDAHARAAVPATAPGAGARELSASNGVSP